MSAPRTVSIAIPPGAESGDTLTFVVDGAELELPIPEGVCAGDVLEIKVGSTDNNVTDKEMDGTEKLTLESNDSPTTNVTEINLLSSGCKLTLHHEISPSVERTPPQSSYTVKTTNSDGTHNFVWPAGKEVVRHLDAVFQRLFPPETQDSCRTVVELGSGLGLVGLALAHQWPRPSQATIATDTTNFVLTDCVAALPLLQYNVDCNRDKLPSHVSMETRALPWQTHADYNKLTTADSPKPPLACDLIVGSDLLYNLDSLDALVDTLERLVKPNGTTRVLLAVRWRKPDLERSFFATTEQKLGLTWSAILPSTRHCDLGWNEYGNPASDSSNRYFMHTLVSIQGGPLKSLAEVDGADVARMTTLEHETWERAQIQFYLGGSSSSSVKEPSLKKRKA